ncbi:MAG: hypothetical protein ACRD3P_03350 [Terriglobales bacterium]
MRKSFAFLSVILASGLTVIPSFSQNALGAHSEASTPSNRADDRANAARQKEDYDPLLDLPPLKHETVTLIGGVVVRLDEVMNHMVFQPFGTNQKMQVHFDTRTHFYLDGKPITEREVKQGQRIYLDTQLNGDRVFAKTIWIRTTAESGVGRGQIIDFDSARRVLTVRDELSNQPLKLQLAPNAIIRKGNETGSESDLVQGALISIEFGAQRELHGITVLAAPGSSFVFAGRVTFVDLSQKMIAIDNRSDGKKYDVSMEAIAPSVLRQIREGEEVSVSTVFDGTRYSARSVDLAAVQAPQ